MNSLPHSSEVIQVIQNTLTDLLGCNQKRGNSYNFYYQHKDTCMSLPMMASSMAIHSM